MVRYPLLVLLLVAGLAYISAPAVAGQRHQRVVAVGDSITDGVGTSDWTRTADGRWVRVAHRYGYPEVAGVRYIAQGSTCVSDECGALSADATIVPRMERLRHVSVFVAHYGINDLVLGVDADHLIAEAKELRREIRDATGARLVFGTIIPPPRGSIWATIQPERKKFNDWVRTQSTYPDYSAAVSCGGWLCSALTNLGDVHVNNHGARKMARALTDWIGQ